MRGTDLSEGKKIKIVEKRCKTALSHSDLPSYDYTINPYTGCLHACVYCYANFMRRFSGHLQDPWGSFVDIKINLLEVLAKELPKRPGGVIWLSSVCDPYQQVEAKYKLTRRAVELVSKYEKFSISILTKNALVLRDIDLLIQMKNRVEVGFTISTFDEKAQPFFEPRSSPVKERIEALRELSQAGLETWVLIAPILPHITEQGLEDGLRQLASAGVKKLMTDRYNARGMIINQTLKAYASLDPTTNLEEIRALLWRGDDYYSELSAKISAIWSAATPTGVHERDVDYARRKSLNQP